MKRKTRKIKKTKRIRSTKNNRNNRKNKSIKKFKRYKKGGTVTEKCSICLEEIDSASKTTIKCINNHRFHDECIKEWIVSSTDKMEPCPLCRQKIVIPHEEKKVIIKELLKDFNLDRLNYYERIFSIMSNSFLRTWEHDIKKIPGLDRKVLDKIDRSLSSIHLFRSFITNEESFDAIINRVDDIIFIVKLGISTIQETENFIKEEYPDIRIQDYRMSQIGVEAFPGYRNVSTRRADVISRPAATTRARPGVMRETRSR